MKASEMRVGVHYIVTKKSQDGSFRKGDHVRLLDDGSIICDEAQGWMEGADAPYATIGMEVEVDRVGIAKKIESLRKQIDDLSVMQITCNS